MDRSSASRCAQPERSISRTPTAVQLRPNRHRPPMESLASSLAIATNVPNRIGTGPSIYRRIAGTAGGEGRQTGLTKRVTSHTFRHSFATHLWLIITTSTPCRNFWTTTTFARQSLAAVDPCVASWQRLWTPCRIWATDPVSTDVAPSLGAGIRIQRAFAPSRPGGSSLLDGNRHVVAVSLPHFPRSWR